MKSPRYTIISRYTNNFLRYTIIEFTHAILSLKYFPSIPRPVG